MCPAFHVSAEHQARELLNIVLLLERCLGLPDATPDEWAEWHVDLHDARRRLDDLLAPGREGQRQTHHLAADAQPLLRPSLP